MLNYADFKAKWLGKTCGNTDDNMGQCVGLFAVWLDNLGLGHVWGNAKDIFNNAPATDFKKTVYKKGVFPVTGDVITWDKNWGGGFGHLAIIDSVDKVANTCTVFEQNNPTGNPPRIHTFTSWGGVIGWLHPYVLDQVSTQTPAPASDDNILQQQLNDMRSSRDAWKQQAQDNASQNVILSNQIMDLNAKIAVMENSINTNKTPLSNYTITDRLLSIWNDLRGGVKS